MNLGKVKSDITEVSTFQDQLVCLDVLLSRSSCLRLVEWRSLGFPIIGGRVQRLKVKKEIQKKHGDLEFFDERDGVYSYLVAVEDVRERVLSGDYSQPLYSLLLLVDGSLDLNLVWESIASVKLMDEFSIYALLEKYEGMRVVRLPLRDYGGAVQEITIE